MKSVEFRKWPGYERLDLLIDSGASVNAIPSHVAAGVNELSRCSQVKRLEYYTASGQTVKATAKKKCVLDFQQGAPLSVEFKTMPLRRPIVSVSRMVAMGNTVVFRSDGQ